MELNQILAEFTRIASDFRSGFFRVLPNVAGAALLLVIGLVAGRFLRVVAYRLLRRLDLLLPGRRREQSRQARKIHQSAKVVSQVLYWMVVFLFVTAATEVLGLPAVTVWLKGLTTYLPNLLAGALIAAAGFVGGALARDVVAAAAFSAGASLGPALGRAVQYAVVTVSLLVAVDQLGIDISFLTWLVAVVLGSVLFGGALAFGLGARTAVGNILAAYYLQRSHRPGQIVRVDGLEGRIVQFLPHAVVLETAEGTAYVPAKMFSETATLRLEKGAE